MFEPIDRVSASRAYALACWLLCALYAAPVLGQTAFQGIVPHWLSLGVQAVILAAMAATSSRLQRGRLAPNARLGRILVCLGAAYLGVALGRIAVGLAVPDAAAWFRMWIPALMHVVIAGFVLAVALFHRREQDPFW